jgi:hypothetical protein
MLGDKSLCRAGTHVFQSEFYIQDALLSHQFFMQYASRTLDFDNMTYIFENSAPKP